MSKERPEYRAPIIKGTLDAVRQVAGGSEALQKVDPKLIAEIEAAGTTDWLPAVHIHALLAPLHQACGDEAIIEANGLVTRSAISHPLFDSIRRGFLSLFGAKPATILSACPRGVRVCARHVGRLTVDTDGPAGRAETLWEYLPPELRVPSFTIAQQGTYRAMLTWVGVEEVHTEVDLSRIDEGRAAYKVSWQPPPEDQG